MNSQLLDSVLLQTDFQELKLHASGKVRDVYLLDQERLLFVATDRISAFDYVLATGIPHKGRVLSQISLFWFDFLSDIVPNHVITADVERYPEFVPLCQSLAVRSRRRVGDAKVGCLQDRSHRSFGCNGVLADKLPVAREHAAEIL